MFLRWALGEFIFDDNIAYGALIGSGLTTGYSIHLYNKSTKEAVYIIEEYNSTPTKNEDLNNQQ